jgi:hypothetical protein
MRSIESNQVETKCWFARSSNHVNSKDSSFASSEGAIICHINPTPYGKYVLRQDILTSTHFIRQIVGQLRAMVLAQLPALQSCITNF